MVVYLSGAPGDQLHTLSDDAVVGVFQKKMNVIGSHHVVEHAKSEAFLRLEQPAQVAAAIVRELKQECLFVAAVSDMPHLIRQKMAVGSRHDFPPLGLAFCSPKSPASAWIAPIL